MKKLYIILFLFLTVFSRAQIVTIPDANFKAKLLQAHPSNFIASSQEPEINGYVSSNNIIDINGDGEIQVSEANSIRKLVLDASQITSLEGISSFVNLKYLKCDLNQLTSLNLSELSNLFFLSCSSNQLVELNISGLTNLKVLNCNFNQLTSLDVSNYSDLQDLSCSNNQLSSLNLNGLINLQELWCTANQISSLNVSDSINLKYLYCSNNQISSINVSGLTNLILLHCSNNPLLNLNLSGLTNLYILDCVNNQLQSLNLNDSANLSTLSCMGNQLSNLNLSQNTALTSLNCSNNDLVSINIKNNIECFSDLDFSNNPNIEYICADDTEISLVQQLINQYGYTNTCFVSSYCSFTPSGTYYIIQGKTQFDYDNTGCDLGDIPFPNMEFNISDGTLMGTIISNSTGNYTFPVLAGTHTYTPVLENPTYFNISPTNAVVTFPTTSSSFMQDFCVTPNGVHHDLEVKIFPLNVARPGFDSSYKIFYKNKGNQTENNTTLSFTYNDDVLDLISTSVIPSSQSVGILNWSLGSILPFYSGEILVNFNLNTPTETPALNAGDILNYTATFNGLYTDESQNDNTITHNQLIVNSYDPNDKTCLEGSSINTSYIGEYVHYMIRFENTGTYPAENIVVKDMIDTTKFDITTLQMISTSHSCYTRINGNKFEFIFENINLPFEDNSNDGYLVFKIKTKSSLTVGSTISNNASIYFDYNFPIITNTATSTFTALNNSDFDFENEFVLHPIPAENTLSITTKNQLEISSISIYTLLGQVVQIETNPNNSIDVSSLQPGNYFIKITTEKGISSATFVKK